MLDKNGKIFGKISIIDIFAIIIIVGVIAGTAYKFYSPNTSVDSGKKTLTYTLKINGVRDFTYDYYEDMLNCFDNKTNEYIGSIVGKRVEPYKERAILLDGTVVEKEKPNVVVIYLDIETPGTETNAAYFANGTYELKAGSEITMRTKYVEVVGTVDNVSAN